EIDSENEQANAVRSLTDSLIIIAEGENGAMTHYTKDLTGGNFPCKGGFILDNTSNNDIFIQKATGSSRIGTAYIFIAAGIDGTRIIRYKGIDSNCTPSYELEYDTITGDITIPGGPTKPKRIKYSGIISSNYNITIPSDNYVELRYGSSDNETCPLICNNVTLEENACLEMEFNSSWNELTIGQKGYVYSNTGTSNGNTYVKEGGYLGVNHASFKKDIIVSGGNLRISNSTVTGAIIMNDHDKYIPGGGEGYDNTADSANISFRYAGNVSVGADSRIGDNYPIVFEYYTGTKGAHVLFDKGLTFGDNVKIYIRNTQPDTLRVNEDLTLEGNLHIYVNDDQTFRIVTNKDIDLSKVTVHPAISGIEGLKPGTAANKEDIFIHPDK
ncbi:MAG: hypothetical protein ACK5MI_08460, partial [Mangrovibacterium sp.]